MTRPIICPKCAPDLSEQHRRALQQHDDAYRDMERMREKHGRNSREYRAALSSVRAAAKVIRPARLGAR